METDDEGRARILATDGRWRLRFALVAVVVPLVLFLLFRRQELRLRALADHGRVGTATVTAVTRRGESAFTHYRYEVDGAEYTWNVGREELPLGPGETLPIIYLPEAPALSRPGAAYSPERLNADLDLPFQRKLLFGVFGFFALAAGWCHHNVRRLQRGGRLRTTPLLSPQRAGQLVALLLLAVVLGANADPKVRTVQAAVFGEAPLGVPVLALVSVAEMVLAAPFFWVFPNLMRIVMDAQRRGASLSKLGILRAVVDAGPEHRRARAIVLAGLAYFVALVAGWIALAQSRGV